MVTVVPVSGALLICKAPLMRLDDAFDDGQSQAAAFFLGGEKGVEDLIQGLGLDAFAIILEADFSPLAVGTGHGGHGQVAALGHGLDGIQENIQEGLVQEILVNHEGLAVKLIFPGDLDAQAVDLRGQQFQAPV